MRKKIKWKTVFILCVFTTLGISFLLGFAYVSSTVVGHVNKVIIEQEGICPSCENVTTTTLFPGLGHKLAIIIPFRDRFEELLEFLPHMTEFLKIQNVPYVVMVINQGDTYRFNRASLVNAGYRLMQEHCSDCDYFAMHDVDLLPLNQELKYIYPKDGPLHLAAPHLHPKYHYAKFVGGILLLTRSQFELVNGMSNRYWGWGLEDDEFFVRLKQANITIQRPGNLTTDSSDTFRHIHNPRLRKRDYRQCYDQKKISLRRDYESGLDNVDFKVAAQYTVTSNGASAVVFNVHLECDRTFSPWCLCPEDTPKEKNNIKKSDEKVKK